MIKELPDLKKTALGVECCLKFPAACWLCPYKSKTVSDCKVKLRKDVLSLMHELDPVEPQIYTPSGECVFTNWFICGNCGDPVDPCDNFCRHCGRAIKWEEKDD